MDKGSYNRDWLISVDDHVLEPPNVWQDRIRAKDRDRAPRIVKDNGVEMWAYEDKTVPTIGLSAVAGKEKEDFTWEPITYEDMRPGCYDPVARLDDMDRAGVLASMCFPSFPRFCGQVFYEATDRDLAASCVRAYNDWMIDEWCGSAPGRYIPLTIVPLWDPTLAAAEVRRCADKGARAIAFSENPEPLGLPTINDPNRYWDPLFEACDETNTRVCMHIGSSSNPLVFSSTSPIMMTLAWSAAAGVSGTMLEWLFSPTLQRFESLKIVLSEGGIGWMPYFLERASQVVDKQRYWAQKLNVSFDPDTGEIRLSDAEGLSDFDVYQTFRDHVYGCFIDDAHGIENVAALGVSNVMIETDYPHSDSTWPACIEVARAQLQGLNDEDAYRILRGNAQELFGFTPAAAPVPTGRG